VSQDVFQSKENVLDSQTVNIEIPSIGHVIEEKYQKYQLNLNQDDKIYVFSKGLARRYLRFSICL
jgi:hypothetical protein